MSRKIYLIIGETGEYSDRIDWYVCAYKSEQRALRHVKELDDWLMERGYHMASPNDDTGYIDNVTCPLDPYFNMSYTGTRYYCAEVELHED